MARFNVEVSTADGRSRERLTIDAPSAAQAARQAMGLGRVPLQVRPDRAHWTSRLHQSVGAFDRIGVSELALFAEQLANLLRAGVTLEQGLALLADGGASKSTPSRSAHLISRSDRALVRLAGRLLRRVREGAALSAALREESSIPQAFVGVVQGGEQAGQLGASLASLAASLQRQAETRERIQSALAYPLTVLVVALLAVLFVLTVVIPEFAPLFTGEERRLPLVTRAVLQLSAMVVGRLHWIGAGLLGMASLAWLAWRRLAGARQRVWRASLRFAPVRYALRLDLAQATRVMGTLLESGLEASQAMQLAGHSAAFADLRSAFGHAARQLREGAALARAYAALPHVPSAAATLLAVGERSGQVGAAALRAAQFIESDTNRRIDRLLATLNPVAVIALGALVGLLIAAIMLGILSINQLALR